MPLSLRTNKNLQLHKRDNKSVTFHNPPTPSHYNSKHIPKHPKTHHLQTTLPSPSSTSSSSSSSKKLNLPFFGCDTLASNATMPGLPGAMNQTTAHTVNPVPPHFAEKGQIAGSLATEFTEDEAERSRRGLALMTTFTVEAVQQHKQGNTTSYFDLISQLCAKPDSPNAPSEAKLLLWIRALSRTVSHLNRTCHALVDAVLSLNWATRDATFADAYVRFIGNLVSAHAFYVEPVARSLVKGFHWCPPEETPPEKLTLKHERMHTALQFILSLIPTATTALTPILASEFPNRWASVEKQVTYLGNALKCTLYAPVARDRVIAVAVDKVIQMDVIIQHEDVFDDSDSESEASDDEDDLGNGIFQCDIQDGPSKIRMSQGADANGQDEDVDDEDAGAASDDDTEALKEVTETKQERLRDVAKLDGLMNELFKFLDSQHALIATSPAARDSWISLRRIFLEVFDRHILPTYRARHAPFLIFRFCCIDLGMPDLFLGLNANKLLDATSSDVTKIASSAYIASYIARDRRLSKEAVRAGTGLLVGWCTSYINAYEKKRRPDEHTSPDAEKHSVFYSVAQAAMYVFCFRWKELRLDGEELERGGPVEMNSSSSSPESSLHADSQAFRSFAKKTGRIWASQLDGLERIITSRFAPLKMMSSSVAVQFARLSRRLGFLYCHPVLLSATPTPTSTPVTTPTSEVFPHHHQYSTTTAATTTTTTTTTITPTTPSEIPRRDTATLDDFFPFDPYRLPSTRHFVDPYYYTWAMASVGMPAGEEGESDDDDDDEVDEEEEEEIEDGEEEEDDSDDVASVRMAMSISPAIHGWGTGADAV